MADNVFDQFDSAPAAPAPVAKGPQPNVFDQFDAKPAAPPPQGGDNHYQDATGHTNIPIQDMVKEAQAGGNNSHIAPQQPPQGAQQPAQPSPQPGEQQARGGQGGQAPSPLGQAEQSGHDAKLQQAMTPPNLTESSIPQPVAPNPPPPQVAPAPSQDQINQQMGVDPSKATASGADIQNLLPGVDVMGRPTNVKPGVTPPKPAGAPPAPASLTSQAIDTLQSVAGSSTSLTPDKALTAVSHGVASFGAKAVQAGGQLVSGMSGAQHGDKLAAAKDFALQNGDMDLYHQLSQVTPEDYAKASANVQPPAIAKASKAIEGAGQTIVQKGQMIQREVDNWTKQHGVDPEKLKAFGSGATMEGWLDAIGEQAPQLAMGEGIGELGAKGYLLYAMKTNPEMVFKATMGDEIAGHAFQRMSTMASTLTVGTAQSVYIGGVAGAEASQRVRDTPIDEMKQQNPVFADAVAHGADPESAREDLAMQAGYRAQFAGYTSVMVAMVAARVGMASKVGQAVSKVSQTGANVASSSAENAVMQGALQASSNYGQQVADPSQNIMQGVVQAGAGGLAIGAGFGMMGGHGEQAAPKAKGKAAPKAEPPSEPPPKADAQEEISSYLNVPNDNGTLGSRDQRLAKIAALDRWSQLDGGRTGIEYKAAMKKLQETGELPDNVTERVANDFNPDGTLTNAALHNDVRTNRDAQILHARVDPEQRDQIVDSLRQAGVNPYVTAQGDITVLGRAEDLAPLQEKLADQAQFTLTENHYGQAQQQDAGHPERVQKPSEGENAEAPEGRGENAEGAGHGTDEADEARQVLTPRSQPVIDRLGEEGLQAPVSGEGRVTVAPGHEQGEQLIHAASHDAAESAENDRREPTPAQKKQGNYPKGKILFASDKGDIPVNIENPAGSVRKSLPGEKPQWSRKVTEHYGYIPGTFSADGEPVDVIVGRSSHDDSRPVFVMQQTKSDGTFDEHKAVLGARSEREAKDMYLKQYPASMHESLLQGQTKMVRMSRPQFTDWLKSGNHDVPINPMSKQPMLKLRPAPGKLESRFSAGTEGLDEVAGSLNERFGTNLKAQGNTITGDMEHAKAPAAIRSLKRTEGHEQTLFNGNESSQVLRRQSERGSERLSSGRAGRQAAVEATGLGSERVPRSGGPAKEETPSPRWMRKPNSDAPRHVAGKGGKNPVEIVGVHYSNKADLQEIDSAHTGSSMTGKERARLGNDTSTVLGNRVHFYGREGRELPKKENVVSGQHAYEARLGNLYDVRSDPDGIIDRAEKSGRGMDKDAMILAIRKAGYDGVVMPGIANDTPVAMLVGKQKVAVKKVEGDQKYIFGGQKAKHAPDSSKVDSVLERASRLSMNEKELNHTLHSETGWHVGADGKLRFEINDFESTMKPREQWEEMAKTPGESRNGAPIESVIKHDELFRNYPQLSSYDVRINPNLRPGEGAVNPNTKVITIGNVDDYGTYVKGNKLPSLKSVLLHELQHGVQTVEGFARGGSHTEFQRVITKKVNDVLGKLAVALDKVQRAHAKGDDVGVELGIEEYKKIMDKANEEGYLSEERMAKKAMDMYSALAGEVEARAVQRRMNLSPQVRAMRHPIEHEDIPRDRQIVKEQDEVVDQLSKNNERERAGIQGKEGEGVQGVSRTEEGKLPGRGGVAGSEGRASLPPKSHVAPLPGLPERVKVNGEVRKFGPSPRAQAAAEAYAKESGIPYSRPNAYTKVNEARAERIARAYEAMDHHPNDPAVKRAYRAMIDETIGQWKAIEKTGLKVDFIKPGEEYPYTNPREVIQDVEENNHMWVFPTDEGFGGSESAHVDVSGNPLLEPTGITINGHPAVANDIFRIVHDYFGHVKEGVGFRAEGEENAWRSHAGMYSPLARKAMTTETRGQNSWVNYGPFAESNKTASGADTQYAPKKVGLLPDWVHNEGATESYSPAEAKAHVDDLQSHVDGLRESWKNSPEIQVVADRHALPEDVAQHMDTSLGGESPDGMYYRGKVYLLADGIGDKAHAEYVLAHETMGHFGLAKTFGPQLDSLLGDIHESIKGSPEFKELQDRYSKAYEGMGARERELAVTEEYLSNRAMLADKAGVLSKVTSWVRRWARQHGMVRDWSQNDILNLMQGVSQNVREGKVSRYGWTPEVTTFNDELGRATTTYTGAAGEGQVVHRLDGSRDLSLGDLKATVFRTMTEDGTGMVVSKLKYKDPSDLLRITRLAGEEAKGYVLFPKSAEGDLKAAGVPTEALGDYVQTPASRVDDQPARFSVKNQPEDPELRDRINRVMAVPESSMSPWDRFQQWGRQLLSHDELHPFGSRFVQQAVDRMVPVANAEMATQGGTLLDAAESAYKMAHLSQNSREVMGSVMKLGVPAYNKGSFEPVPGRKGLMDILNPLYQHPVKGFDRMWEFYAMARRASQLRDQTNTDGTSKEKLMTEEDIKAGMDLAVKYPVMEKVFNDWQDFNKQALDLAVERGNMTSEMAELWKQNDYVPFYRVADEDGLNPKGKMPGGLRVSSKRLTGSDRQVEPLIENIINNTGAVIRKVYRNEALRRAAALGETTGQVERMPTQFRPVRMQVAEIEKSLEKMGLFVGQQSATLNQGAARGAKVDSGRPNLRITPEQQDMWTRFFKAQEPMGADSFAVMENGKPVYFKGIDKHYLQAMNSIKGQQQLEGWFTKLFGIPKNFLTHAITLNPAFMMRHLERQLTHTWIQSGENFNPFSNAVGSAHDAYTNSEFMQKMAMAGAGGNEYYDIDQMREAMRGMGTHSTILDTGHKAWMAYRKIGFVADQMNRMSIAKNVIGRGGSTAEAAWQAQDLLNFRMHGDSSLMRHLISAVPFLNARVQGMYRIVRGAQGIDQSYKARSRAVIAFMIKSATLIAASQMLALKNNGDPRYERLPDEAKDMYWHIFVGNNHFAIAKPFELGALFSTLPDRAVRYAEGLDGSGTFKQSLQRVLETVFRTDPTPALVNPMIQDWRNKDAMTQRPIVPENLSKVAPPLQFNPYTSPTLQGVAQHMPEFAPDIVRSPLRLQHLVDGYVGSLGIYAINAADAAMRATHGAPAGPTSRLPGGSLMDAAFGSMVGKVDTDPRNRYSSMIFEDKRKLDEIAQTVSKYKKNNDIEGLNRYYMQHKTALQYKGDILNGYRVMEDLRKQEQSIYSSTILSSDQKREQLDKITKQQNAYLDKLAPMLNLADSNL